MARLFDDGSSEYLENSQAVLTAYPFAFSAWFYSDSLTVNQGVITIADSGSTGNFWLLGPHGVAAGDPLRYIIFADPGIANINTTTGYSANTWHHACCWSAAAYHAVTLDGGGKNTNTQALTPPGLDRTAIGRFADSTPNKYMSGRIAEVAIWDLSDWPGATDADKADEFERVAVSALAAGFAPSFFPLGLKAYWPLIRDEDQDRVGGYDLTAYNTPSIASHPPIIYPAPPRLGFIAAAAGGATYYQSCGGVLTFTGGLVKKTSKSLAGSITPTGSLVKKTSKGLSGALTFAGGVVKKTSKGLVGNITFVGNLGTAATFRQALSGAVTFAGSLSTALIMRQALSGAISFVGDLATQYTAGPGGAWIRWIDHRLLKWRKKFQ